MSRTRYRVFETDFPYFLTCTVVGWLPVFTRTWAVQTIFEALKHLQQHKSMTILGYVVMENHLHLIAKCPTLTATVQQFKSFTAKTIIQRLTELGEQHLLEQLAWEKKLHKTESQRQFWQEGSHPQQIQSEEMLQQKLAYIHNNPVRRGYVDDPTHWRSSSARNYAGLTAMIDIEKDW